MNPGFKRPVHEGYIIEVAQQQIPDKGGYLRKVISFFIADTKAQVILGGCSSFTAKNPAATVCWLCGKNWATIVHEFGCGMRVIVEEWLWARMIFLWLNTWVAHPPCIHLEVFLFCLYAIAF